MEVSHNFPYFAHQRADDNDEVIILRLLYLFYVIIVCLLSV